MGVHIQRVFGMRCNISTDVFVKFYGVYSILPFRATDLRSALEKLIAGYRRQIVFDPDFRTVISKYMMMKFAEID